MHITPAEIIQTNERVQVSGAEGGTADRSRSTTGVSAGA